MEVPDWDAAETFQALRGGRGYEAGGFETGAGGAGGGAAGSVRERKKRGRAPLPTRRVDLRAVHGCLKGGDEPSGGQGASGSKRRRRERKKRRREGAERGDAEPEVAEGRAKPAPAGGSGDAAAAVNPFRAPAPSLAGGGVQGSMLLSKMQQKLQGAQFRWLNEKLYTCSGDEAFELMQESPGSFGDYHAGFRSQTQHWPVQPIEKAIQWVRKLPRDAAVADFGCGDAMLAARVKHKVHSFDLVAANDSVTACNMSDVPLGDCSVSAGVFCLALMGTDYGSFLVEAHRVLKPGGRLWIAEVRSRFQTVSGGDGRESDFVQCVRSAGFALREHDASNKMFVTFLFQKTKEGPRAGGPDWPLLKACTYKKR